MAKRSAILKPGRNCSQLLQTGPSGVLIDAANYYRAFYQACLLAQHSIWIVGWEFHSKVALLCGAEADRAKLPVTLLKFLSALCAKRPTLQIHILAWNHSAAYLAEREWFQRFRFRHSRLRFELDSHPAPGGSHHHKFVVIDGLLGFVGGIDFCASRWDESSHTPNDRLRRSPDREAYDPHHDVQAYTSGPAVSELMDLFMRRWQQATGQAIERVPPRSDQGAQLRAFERAVAAGSPLQLNAQTVAFSQTDGVQSPKQLRQLEALYSDAFTQAERLIYAETQYFTSRRLTEVLVSRFERGPRLTAVIVMPREPHMGKEQFALGGEQARALSALIAAARHGGHHLSIGYPGGAARNQPPTFVHAKLLIVDDCFLSIGSANFTNRSLGLDTELNLCWEAEDGATPLARDIAELRARLVAEHAGVTDPTPLTDAENFGTAVDKLLTEERFKLRRVSVTPGDSQSVRLLVFDPEQPVIGQRLKLLARRAYKSPRLAVVRGSGKLRYKRS